MSKGDWPRPSRTHPRQEKEAQEDAQRGSDPWRERGAPRWGRARALSSTTAKYRSASAAIMLTIAPLPMPARLRSCGRRGWGQGPGSHPIGSFDWGWKAAPPVGRGGGNGRAPRVRPALPPCGPHLDEGVERGPQLITPVEVVFIEHTGLWGGLQGSTNAERSRATGSCMRAQGACNAAAPLSQHGSPRVVPRAHHARVRQRVSVAGRHLVAGERPGGRGARGRLVIACAVMDTTPATTHARPPESSAAPSPVALRAPRVVVLHKRDGLGRVPADQP